MKYLLINTKEEHPKKEKCTSIPPFKLWQIRTMLEKVGMGADVCDIHINQNLNDFIKKNKYVGIFINAKWPKQNKSYLKTIKKINKLKDVPIITSGVHASRTKKPKRVELVVGNDGLDYFNMFGDLIYPHPRFTDKDIFPYWKISAPHNLFTKTKRWMAVETSIGCNHTCGYCLIKDYYSCWKPYPLNWCSNYFKYLSEKKIEEIFFEDDNISTDNDRFLGIIEELNKYNFVWSCPNGFFVKDLFNKEIFNAITKSKCWRISLPFETGLKETAKLMKLGKKFIEFEQAKEIVTKLNEANIWTCGFFIIGYPGETKEDIKKTLEYANNLPLVERHIHLAAPYPGTDLYRICKQNGYLTCDGEKLYSNLLYSKFVIKTKDFSPKEILKIRKKDREEAIERRTEATRTKTT